jgi:hypothetical protein
MPAGWLLYHRYFGDEQVRNSKGRRTDWGLQHCLSPRRSGDHVYAHLGTWMYRQSVTQVETI